MTDTVKNIGRIVGSAITGAALMWGASQTLLSHGSDWGSLNRAQLSETKERTDDVARLVKRDDELQKALSELTKTVGELGLAVNTAQNNYKFIDSKLIDIKSDLGELKKMVLENRGMSRPRSYNQSDATVGKATN